MSWNLLPLHAHALYLAPEHKPQLALLEHHSAGNLPRQSCPPVALCTAAEKEVTSYSAMASDKSLARQPELIELSTMGMQPDTLCCFMAFSLRVIQQNSFLTLLFSYS